ncbi:hypothetical protein KR084_011268 [Drosophila pseudotakahashii]|nr:hypothetical protein KR084_011268 [Drosophila pseudotakahashii]
MDCCELSEIFLSFLNDLFFSDISNYCLYNSCK